MDLITEQSIFYIFMLCLILFLFLLRFYGPKRKDFYVSEDTRIIPGRVKREVWRRDGGKCVKCGSRDRLEFDHIIPVSKGGSNTTRNIELLCEKCNREKSDIIG